MTVQRRHILTAIVATAVYAAPLIYLYEQIGTARFADASHERPGEINIIAYGAKADGVTDDGAAFESAFADAAKRGVAIVIPKGTYLVNRELVIDDRMVIRSSGAIIKHTDGNANIFVSRSADGWTLQGPTLMGTRTASDQEGDETGLTVISSSRFIVDKLTVMNFRGAGIRITSGKRPKLAARGRGNHGQFAFVSFIANNIGLDIQEGPGAEYNLFTLLSFSDNGLATRIAAGNNIIAASNVVDNASGIALESKTPNDGHGIFSAANINHNAAFNVRTANLLHGYTFNACHIRTAAPSEGKIELVNSAGIKFVGGDINTHVFDQGAGINVIADNFIHGTMFDVINPDAKGLYCTGLFHRDKLLPWTLSESCGR